MKSLCARFSVAMLTASLAILSVAGCSGVHHPPPTLSSIAVTPANPSVAAGLTQQFTATGTYSDGSTKDLTTQVTWSSATTAKATITPGPGASGGLATTVAVGTSDITATLGAVSGKTTLTVTAAVVKSIAVAPTTPSIAVGATQQFTATGTFSDGSIIDITAQVTWSSATTAKATITPGPGASGGLATAVAVGSSVITATLGSVSGTATLTVTAPVTLSSIAVTPANPTIGVGQTLQFTATGTYSDGSAKNITTQVTWSSATIATATITPGPGASGGLATAVAAPGSSVITATLGANSGNTTLTVTPAVLTSITVAPATPTVAVGMIVNFTATGHYSDGSTQPLAGVVTWSSVPPTSASINSSTGVAQGLAAGTSSTITATAGAVNGNTLLSVTAVSSRFAYTGNSNDGTISIYAVNPANGTFANRGFVVDNAGPTQVISDLSGKYAYALNGDATIGIYNVEPVSGSLTFSPILTNPVNQYAGAVPTEGVIDPTGRFLYVANQANNNVTAYSVDPTAGGLTPLTGSPYTVGSSPLAVVTDLSGKFLYVTNSGSSNVSGFTINSDGTLAPIAGSPFLVGAGVIPTYPAIDPANQHLFVPDNGSTSVYVLNIGVNGALTAVAGSPFSTGVGAAPTAVAVDPSGKYLYVTNNGDGTVSGLTIGAGGALGAALAGSPYPAASATSQPYGVTVDPGGSYVAVANQLTNNISLYSLNGTTGVLTPTLTVEAHQLPSFLNIYIASAPPIIAPAAVFAANRVSNDVSAFTVTPSTGALTSAAGSPFAGATSNGLAASDLAGKFFYTTGPTAPGSLAGFSVTQSTAALTGLTGSPASLGGAVSSTVLADPSEQFVYVAGTGVAGSILGYSIDMTTTPNTLNQITGSPFTGYTNLNALAMDPQGLFLFALENNNIQTLEISVGTGVIGAGLANAAPGTWTAGAIDASGHFLLAVDSVAKTIQVFSIAPAALSPGTDGKLTAVGSAVSVGGTLPSSIVIDPLDRFVFVTDATANTITTFSFNVTTGGVAQVGLPVSVSSAAGQAAVDATGTYLYVALLGNPAALVPGSVAAFKIGATGTLTAVPGPFTAGTGTTGVAISNSIN